MTYIAMPHKILHRQPTVHMHHSLNYINPLVYMEMRDYNRLHVKSGQPYLFTVLHWMINLPVLNSVNQGVTPNSKYCLPFSCKSLPTVKKPKELVPSRLSQSVCCCNL